MDTPDIRPYLKAAIDRFPEAWRENTYSSCDLINAETLKRAGVDWFHVGKSSQMGEGDIWLPPGLRREVDLLRPDGQLQRVLIDKISHDAAWHRPSGRQVKVIVNSAANSDPRPEIHGPARIGGDIIPVKDYRWHNPPVAQWKRDELPQPHPQPQPQPGFTITDDELKAAAENLEQMYKTELGRQQADRTYVDVLGRGRWPVDYYTARVQGFSHDQALQVVRWRIRDAARLPQPEPLPTL